MAAKKKYYELKPIYDVGEAPFFNFPRPLYPPDHPDGPMEYGPDIEAYKIIAWYFGRWATTNGVPNEKPDFDQNYTNDFAHGKSGNVGESGIEGIQRQAEVAGANGVLGHRTFDILIYQRIPEGLPFAGKLPLGIDDRAPDLLREAYQRFHEEPEEPVTPPTPPPDSADARRQKIAAHMEARVGYEENPWGSNFDSRPDGIHKAQDVTASGHWLDKTAWCGEWCMYALTAGGFRVDSDICSVAAIETMAQNNPPTYPFRGWTTDKSKISQCDLVVVGGHAQHVEMVRLKANPDGSVPTWGGNTSPGTSGSQSNGGGAYRRVRYPSEIHGFALVDFS